MVYEVNDTGGAHLTQTGETSAESVVIHARDAGHGVLEIIAGSSPRAKNGKRHFPAELIRAALADEKYPHWLITLSDCLSEAAVDEVTSLFPRRLALGRVAIVCEPEAHMQGVFIAAAITLPLVPRPIRVFHKECATDAYVWASSSDECPPSSSAALDVAERIMVGTARSRTLPN